MDILMNDKEEYKNIEDEFARWTVTAMLDHCFLSYSEQVKQFGLLKNDKKLQSILAQIPHMDFEEYQQGRQKKLLAGRTHHRTGRKLSVQKEQEDNTYDPDEFICHECKEFVNYQWIEVDILKKIAADLQDTSKTNGQKQLPTPGSSPSKSGSNNKGEDIESEWKQIMEEAREEGLNESIKSGESHAGMRLRKRRKIVRNDNSDTYELSSDYGKQRKEKMLNRIRNKRRKHYNFGKMVFCLNCFTRGISKMDPTQIEQLKKISVVYNRESYEHLREHIEKMLKPKLGLLGIRTHH